MKQKLAVNSIVRIEIPQSNNTGRLQEIRCYVIDYNEHERSYTVLPIRPPYYYTKTLLVREKVIDKVVQVVSTSPNFNDWLPTDALAFFTHEYNILSKAKLTTKYTHAPTDYSLLEYMSKFKDFENSCTSKKLLSLLTARKHLLRSRKLPLEKVKISRTVMRRLRKKAAMRNSNSSVSKSKQRTIYMTPNDIVKEQTSNIIGISSKIKFKKKKVASLKSMTPQQLYESIKKERLNNKEKLAKPSLGMPTLTFSSSQKKRKKRLTDTTMPF